MPHRIVPAGPIGATADQVRRRLLEQISAGTLVPGQRLGAERDLAVELGVSRSTLRQALAALEADGTVRRVPGRGGGTFVSSDKIDRDLSRIVGVPALLRDQGFTAGSKVMSASVVARRRRDSQGTAHRAGFLRLRRRPASDSRTAHRSRWRTRDCQPSGSRACSSSPSAAPSTSCLETEFGVRPAEAEERIEVVAANEDEGLILGVPAGSPLLSITRTSVDEDGVPIEHSHDLFRADRTRITVRTRGDVGTAATATARGKLIELRPRTY